MCILAHYHPITSLLFIICVVPLGHCDESSNATSAILNTSTTTTVSDTSSLDITTHKAYAASPAKSHILDSMASSVTVIADHSRLPEWVHGLLQGVVPGSSLPHNQMLSLLDNTPASVLSILQKMRELGTYANRFALQDTLTSQCVLDLKVFEDGLSKMELWALKMADAMGKLKPGFTKGQTTLVGDYDQCRGISQVISPNHTIVGQFCRLGLKLNLNALGSIPDKAAALSSLLSNIMVHTCVPNTCNDSDVYKLFRGIFDTTGAELVPETTDCVHAKDPTQDKDFWAAIGVFSCLAFLCFLGTVVGLAIDCRRESDKDETDKDTPTDCVKAEKGLMFKGIHHDNRAFEDETEEKGQALSQELSSIDGVPKSFSASSPVTPPAAEANVAANAEIVRNGQSTNMSNGAARSKKGAEDSSPIPKEKQESLCTKLILSFSVLKNGEKILHCGQAAGDLSCVHGVRVLSITWVILGHCFVMYGGTQGNRTDTFRLMSDWTMMPVQSGTLSVDTFFLLSGLLTAYIFLRQVKRTGGLTVKAMVLYYFHRFWRLTPLYMLVLAYEGCIAYYTWLGPFDQPRHAAQNCKTYWWYNLLYINNFFPPDKLCVEWSWYLANDMQFYVIAPIALIPWILNRKIIGSIIPLLLVAVHVGTTGYIAYRDNSSMMFTNSGEYFTNVYVKPWCRVGPFAIGLLVGYALYRTRCQYKMHKLSVLAGWTLAAAVGLAVVYLPYDNVKDVALTSLPAWGRSQSAAYEALSRPLWSAAVAWVVWACCTGHGGFVNTLLSWKAWVPLSRLSYGVYLLHLVVFFTFVKNSFDTYYVNAFTATEMFLCVTVTTFMASFLFSLLIEAPTLGIEKALLGSNSRRQKEKM